jgi:CubicO group peptidase (beta-lactamase class C family)
MLCRHGAGPGDERETAGVRGTVDPAFAAVRTLLEELADLDATYSGALCAWHRGRPVVDISWGPVLGPDDLLPVFSSSKGAAGLAVACLVRDGLLDLDETVASYWPDFAQRGKAAVTVRQLLSHQAGLLGVDGGYTYDELYGHAELAARLAAQRPLWLPGSAFAYHGVTIGVLADELVRRIAGVPLGEYFHHQVAGPRRLEVYLGTPEALDGRVRAVELPTPEELAALPDAVPRLGRGSLASLSVPVDGQPMYVECNEARFRRAGTPAAGGLASARGLAGMYAAVEHEVAGVPRLLDDETVAQVSQLQVWGRELTQTEPLRTGFAIIFQKPSDHHPWGSYRAFGHDGSLAYADPFNHIAFAYAVARIPLPGGADSRAIHLSRAVRRGATATALDR